MTLARETRDKPSERTPEAPTWPAGRSEGPLPFPGYYGPYPAPEEDEIDLMELWRVLVRQRWTIFLVTFLVTGLAAAAAFLMTPVYRAEVLMAPVSASEETGRLASLAGRFGGLASLAGIELGGEDLDAEATLATLKSREFTNAFVTDNNLLPVLFEQAWDPVGKTWTVEDPADAPTLWDAYGLFDKKIRAVTRDKKTGLVTLSIEWKDRVQAVQWANELVERINRRQQQRAIGEAEESIAFLKAHLEKTAVAEIQHMIYRLMESEGKKIMLATVRDEYAFEVIDPAAVPDEDDIAKPKRKLMIALGFVGGLMLGGLLAFFRSFIERQSEKGQAGVEQQAGSGDTGGAGNSEQEGRSTED